MTKQNDADSAASDQSWVLSTLEPDQLVKAKNHPIPAVSTYGSPPLAGPTLKDRGFSRVVQAQRARGFSRCGP